jgi:hypothetical protein
MFIITSVRTSDLVSIYVIFCIVLLLFYRQWHGQIGGAEIHWRREGSGGHDGGIPGSQAAKHFHTTETTAHTTGCQQYKAGDVSGCDGAT